MEKWLDRRLSRKEISFGCRFKDSWRPEAIFLTRNAFAGSKPPSPWQFMYKPSSDDHWFFMHMIENGIEKENIIGHPVNLEDVLREIVKLKHPKKPMLQSRIIKLWTFGQDIYGQSNECILFLYDLFPYDPQPPIS